jgi:hypothetical protein
MKNTAKLDQRYILATILATALGYTALTTVAYAQQQNEEIPLHSHGPNAGDGYTEEDLPVPDSQSIEGTDAPAKYTMPPEVEAAVQAMAATMDAYKRCVRDIIANDTPAVDKHDQMDAQCGTQRQQIIDTLPPDQQEFILLNMDRRIDLVLRTMAEAEGVVDDSAEDIAEAVIELSVEDKP